jgi:hypothetical protein
MSAFLQSPLDEIHFGIEIDLKPGTPDPARVYRAMTGLIEDCQPIDIPYNFLPLRALGRPVSPGLRRQMALQRPARGTGAAPRRAARSRKPGPACPGRFEPVSSPCVAPRDTPPANSGISATSASFAIQSQGRVRPGYAAVRAFRTAAGWFLMTSI